MAAYQGKLYTSKANLEKSIIIYLVEHRPSVLSKWVLSTVGAHACCALVQDLICSWNRLRPKTGHSMLRPYNS